MKEQSENLVNEITNYIISKDKLNETIYDRTAELIEVLAGGTEIPLVFDEETGLPAFFDSSKDEDDEDDYVVGVRVRRTEDGVNVIEFNVDVDESTEDGLDAEGWFQPKLYGDYDDGELLECLSLLAERI